MSSYSDKNNKNAKGNVLFLILITIGLFGALTYTLAKSNRTATYSQDSDDHAKAQEVLAFAEKIGTAVNRIHFQNNCRTSYINFSQQAGDDYENLASPANERCNVFSHEGGAIKYLTPPAQLLDKTHSSDAIYGEYIFSGNVCVDRIGSGTADSCDTDNIENEELMIFLPWIKQSVCRTINSILGNEKLIEDAGSSFDGAKFKGVFTDGFAISDIMGGRTYNIGCFKSGSTPGDGYHFYYTLLEK